MVNNNLILDMWKLYLETNFKYRQIKISSKDIIVNESTFFARQPLILR